MHTYLREEAAALWRARKHVVGSSSEGVCFLLVAENFHRATEIPADAMH